jgi:hypothetical protein
LVSWLCRNVAASVAAGADDAPVSRSGMRPRGEWQWHAPLSSAAMTCVVKGWGAREVVARR